MQFLGLDGFSRAGGCGVRRRVLATPGPRAAPSRGWCRPGGPSALCKYGPPRVLGDKRGGGTSQILESAPNFPQGAVGRLLAFSQGLALPLLPPPKPTLASGVMKRPVNG